MKTEIINTRFGQIEIFQLDKVVRKALKGYGAYQSADINMLLDVVNKESIFIDLGAHVGTFTIPIAQKAKKVVSIEADKRTFRILKNNIARNQLNNITALNTFVSSKSGINYLPDRDTITAPNSGGNTWNKIKENSTSEFKNTSQLLIDIIEDQITAEDTFIIKSDIQGFDLEVLLSIEELIREKSPIIEVEIYGKTDADLIDVFEKMLKENGYSLFVNLAPNNSDIFDYIPFEISSLSEFNQGIMFDLFCIPKNHNIITIWKSNYSQDWFKSYASAMYVLKYGGSLECALVNSKMAYNINKTIETTFLYAQVCFKNELWSEAKTLLDFCSTLKPNSAEIKLNIAKILFKLKQTKSAIVALREAIKINSNRPDYHFFLGKYLHANKESVKAIPHLEKFIAESTNTVKAYQLLIKINKQLNKLNEALAISTKAINEYPEAKNLLKLNEQITALSNQINNQDLDNKTTSFNTTAVHTFDNGLKVHSSHLLKGQLKRYEKINLHEPEEEKMFVEQIDLIPHGGCYLNIGSAIGYYAILAKLLRPDLKVCAVEPLHLHRKYFKENTLLNGFRETDFQLYPFCVGSNHGNEKFLERRYGSRLENSNQIELNPLKNFHKISEVKVVPLNFLIKKIGTSIDFLSIDVQGLELDVLKGGMKSLKDKTIQTILVGTHSSQIHSSCINQFTNLGMKIVMDNQAPENQSDGIIIASFITQ